MHSFYTPFCLFAISALLPGGRDDCGCKGALFYDRQANPEHEKSRLKQAKDQAINTQDKQKPEKNSTEKKNISMDGTHDRFT